MKHINTFIKGLDKDTNYNSYSNESYPYALNLRILSDNSAESGTLTNMEDDKLMIEVPTGETVVGISTIRENLIVFTKGSGAQGKIYKVPFSELLGDDKITLGISYRLALQNFNFGTNVQVVARYETPNVQKIYWVDGVNPVRFANIESDDIGTQDLSKFNIVPEVELSTPELDSIINGTLSVGVYQYAYCLYDSNGAETAYSPATPPIPLSEASLSDANSMDFQGSDIGKNSGKGVKITIDGIDSRFTGVRIVRLFYATQTGTPEVSIVYEGEASSSLTFNDSGGVTLGSLILEDVRYIPNILIAKTIETKNDYLFAGNITQEYFDLDFDARAYRFFGVNDGKVYTDDSFSSSFDVVDFTGNFKDVPEEYNFVASNKIEATSYWTGSGTSAIYQRNGTTVGGEGPNITYSFKVSYRDIENAVGSSTPLKTFTTATSDGYNDLSNPIVLHKQLGYQRSEIYRFGIVFYDKYGRQSFVKWIGDIRFPDENTPNRGVVNGSNIQDLGIQFNLKTNGVNSLPSDVVGWQIVRAERTYTDATVKDCGFISSLENDPDSSSRVKFRTDLQYNSSYRTADLVEYISPETNYNKNNEIDYDRIDLVNVVTPSPITLKNTYGVTPKANSFLFRRSPGTVKGIVSTRGCLLFNADKTSKNSTLGTLSYGSYTVSNILTPMSGIANKCVHGTCLLLRLSTAQTAATYGYYGRRRSFSYPYGGYTTDAIKNTIYYPCSPIFSINTTVQEVWGGDCYIGVFEYMRGLMTKDSSVLGSGTDPSSRMANQISYLLTESKINTMYTVNPRWSRLDDGIQISDSDTKALSTGSYVYNAMWETTGVHEAGTPTGGDAQFYEQDYNLYTYNPVYSLIDKSKVFFVRPSNLSEENTIDTRIYRTTRKFNGELADSWTKFPINNQLDVDTKYGALTKLLTFKDKLLYFQEKGVGIIPIQEREVVTGQSGNATTLGVGGVMERYDYISTTSGTNNLEAISTSNNGIYYIDTLNKKICKLGENVEFLSDLKGIKSDMLIKPFTNVSTLFNPNYNELWFFIDDTTYIFNEYTGVFVSEISDAFIKNAIINNKVIRFDTHGYRLDEPNTARDWELHILVNPNNLITNRFDSITFGSTREDAAVIPIDYITLSNRTQESFTTDLNSSNTRHRFRNWIFNAVRDNNEMRMYDSYLKIVLEGGVDEKVKIYDILTNYTPINNR